MEDKEAICDWISQNFIHNVKELTNNDIDYLTDIFKKSLHFYRKYKGHKIELEIPEDERYEGMSETVTIYPTKPIEDGIDTTISLVQSNELLIKLFLNKEETRIKMGH